MKLIDLSHAIDSSTESPQIAIATDSAIVLGGKPLFLPDQGHDCVLSIAAACRISRLGKSIPTRYALRHIDAMTLVGHAKSKTRLWCDPEATASDFSYTCGQWIDPLQPQQITLALSSLSDSEKPAEHHIIDLRSTDLMLSFAEAINRLSQKFTLKNGDIIVVAPPTPFVDVAIDTLAEASIDNQSVLKFRIK